MNRQERRLRAATFTPQIQVQRKEGQSQREFNFVRERVQRLERAAWAAGRRRSTWGPNNWKVAS